MVSSFLLDSCLTPSLTYLEVRSWDSDEAGGDHAPQLDLAEALHPIPEVTKVNSGGLNETVLRSPGSHTFRILTFLNLGSTSISSTCPSAPDGSSFSHASKNARIGSGSRGSHVVIALRSGGSTSSETSARYGSSEEEVVCARGPLAPADSSRGRHLAW